LEGVGAAAALARLYASVRLFVNFFQPSFKLADKQRDGARIKKRYHQPATPYQRLLADPRTPEEDAMHATLDPVRLLREIRVAQQRILEIADKPIDGDSAADSTFLEQFLVGLRRVWRDGEARPTARAKAKTPRLRRRPDPFATVSAELRAWFKAEPAQTERELFERLQAQYPGTYPDGQLRTCQRRFKGLAPGNGAQAPSISKSGRSPPLARIVSPHVLLRMFSYDRARFALKALKLASRTGPLVLYVLPLRARS
jgi:hypothetical protein